MKTFAEKNNVSQRLIEVKCNQCGHSVRTDKFGYFDDYVSIRKEWGYFSASDGEIHHIDICMDCYTEWIKSFTIPPQIVSTIEYL